MVGDGHTYQATAGGKKGGFINVGREIMAVRGIKLAKNHSLDYRLNQHSPYNFYRVWKNYKNTRSMTDRVGSTSRNVR